jgi:hypothetical protein
MVLAGDQLERGFLSMFFPLDQLRDLRISVLQGHEVSVVV